MKKRKKTEKPTTKESIKKDIEKFISELPLRYKETETGYRNSLYRLLAECGVLAELATDELRIRKKIQSGAYWSEARQKCPEGEHVKLVVHHMLQPDGRTERATASKYVAVIDYLTSKGSSGSALHTALSNGGGIENIYAKSTGRRPEQASQTRSDNDELHETPEDDLEADTEDLVSDATELSHGTQFPGLEVFVTQKTLDKVLDHEDQGIIIMELTIGGAPVPGKPKGFKRVTGRIKKKQK